MTFWGRIKPLKRRREEIRAVGDQSHTLQTKTKNIIKGRILQNQIDQIEEELTDQIDYKGHKRKKLKN